MSKKKSEVSRALAVIAKCHDCMGCYEEGKLDCGVVGCSLYSFMPYRKLEPDLSWTEINPKKKGVSIVEKRQLSDEQRRNIGRRLSKWRNGERDDNQS